MKHSCLSIAFLMWVFLAVVRSYGQPVPLVPGNEWVYVNSDTRDTVSVRIIGSGRAGLHCGQGERTHEAWFDDAGLAYVPLGGGMMIGRRDGGSPARETIHPMFMIEEPGTRARQRKPAQSCPGAYGLIGTATVTTPAGVFDDCLIFDDHSIHRICVKPGVGIVREERYEAVENGETAAERTVAGTRVLVRYHLAGISPR